MNRAELVEVVRRELGPHTTRVEAERAVRAVLDAITTGLRRERSVQLVGFGTFKVAARATHEAVNPRTREPVVVAPSASVRFTAGKNLRTQV